MRAANFCEDFTLFAKIAKINTLENIKYVTLSYQQQLKPA